MSIQISYRFVIKKEKNKQGLYPIYLRAFLKGKKIETATPVAIPLRDWSLRNQRVKSQNNHHERYNMILDAIDKKSIKLLVDNFLNEEYPLSLIQFKDRLLALNHYSVEQSFTDYILGYLEENKTKFKIETWFGYKSQISKMLKFKKEILFSNINERFINDYRQYMLNTLSNNENTASKSLRVLRTFVNISMRFGYIKTNPFQYTSIKKVDGKRDFLSIEELNKLTDYYSKDNFNQSIEKDILGYFLFACYTGLRYSDLKTFSADSIIDNSIHLRMHKTGYLVNIPLSKKAKKFIPATPFNSKCVFRIYCNKVTNRVLKKIGIELELNKKLTCHVARHTFATVSISLGIPIEVVSKLLGHTSIRTTQVYAKIVDTVKIKEMQKWDK
ncbi:site-specific integrase [Sphingobacterium spiritivorum]|uniref:Tyrosine recombinase XerC n=1 Tax=Sphingobacterium spiritivorum TaxID=258 RepID=A0A380BUF2_SPHSI|nr:site-specific integrase [Sphingobacterium spiritivorum]SUJ07331.1 Tyrosine recombinase XerC [Sphingobacterium spiritivorum]